MSGVRTLIGSVIVWMRRRWRALLSGAVVGLAAGLAITLWWFNHSFDVARRAFDRQNWSAARAAVARYLVLHPRNPTALLLMAQTYIRDEKVPQEQAAQRAIEYLQRITDNSTYAVDARTQEAWVRLFMLHTPGRAEEILERAIELDRFAVEPRYLLWKLYDLTGRSNLAEDIVWQVLNLTPEQDRAMRLREWYMSQFFPLTGCMGLDYRLGLLAEGQVPTVDVERERFLLFRNAEPDRALGHAALGRWLTREGMPQVALEVLQLAEKQLPPDQQTSPFFLATMIEVCIDLGKFDDAKSYFARWPAEDRGFEYWRWRGVLAEEVHSDFQGAVEAYDQALRRWPGPVDWRMRVRKANCLARLGRAEEAARVRQEAQHIESQMSNAVHERLRRLLANLNDRAALLAMAEFYRDLGRAREAASWLQLALKLPVTATQPVPGDSSESPQESATPPGP